MQLFSSLCSVDCTLYVGVDRDREQRDRAGGLDGGA
jgi:hypothetical protein